MKAAPVIRCVVVLALLIVSACASPKTQESKLTKENYEKITLGMTAEDAKRILGIANDARAETKGLPEKPPVTTTELIMEWREGNKYIKLTFSNKDSPTSYTLIDKSQSGL